MDGAQQKVDDLVTSISKLWGAFRELAADYWGPTKTNGLRSRVDDHEERLDELEESVRHYIDAQRRETCYGVAALKEYQKDLDGKEESLKAGEQVKAKIEGEVEVEKIRANSASTVQILTLIGVLVGPVLLELVKGFFK